MNTTGTRPRSRHFLVGAVLCTALVLSCKGKVLFDLNEPGVLVRSGDLVVPAKVFQSMFGVMRRARLKEGNDPRAALFLVVADHYLAQAYLKLHGGRPDAVIAAEISKVYHETLAYFLNDKDPQKLYRSWLRQISIPEKTQLSALFDRNAPAAYTNIPLRRADAEKIILATYGADGKGQLTYAQLFDSLPHAGQLHLFTAPDRNALREMTENHLRSVFLDEFVARADEAEKAEYAALRRLVENSILSRNYRYELGMENANPHAANPAVAERAKSVSMRQVRKYFNEHKDNYREVQSVDCRHIQLKDYDQAINLRDQIDAGKDMVALVKKYSLAEDRNQPDPGLIKGIRNDTELHKRPRIETLCMMPKQGESEVVRDGDFFHVVKAERRVDGYPPLDETTHLKEDIAREIAALELKAEFEARKKKILNRVDIHINKTELEKIR